MLQKQLGESEHFRLHLCVCEWQPHLCCSAWLWLDGRGLKNNRVPCYPWMMEGELCLLFWKPIDCYLSGVCVSPLLTGIRAPRP